MGQGGWELGEGGCLSREVSSEGRMERGTPWGLQAARGQGDESCSILGATSEALSKVWDQGTWPPFP